MSTEQNQNTPQSIYDLSCDSTDKNILKKKISESLENLNQSSQVFDDMINDYNTL